jgi:hypothetical protein
MGYNISTLPDFKSEGKGFLVGAIQEAKTIKMLSAANAFDASAKGSQTVQILGNNATIQDGSNCGFTPIGGADLTQAILTVKPLKINEEYCQRQLERIWANGELKPGQDYDEMLFQADIAAVTVSDLAAKLEKMIWLGDTATVGVTPDALALKQLDGFVKKIKAGSYINLQTSVVAGKVIDSLSAMYNAMPIEETDSEDFRILIGKDTYNKYVAELAKANLFNPTTAEVLFTTVGKMEVLSGLNGGHVVLSRLQNLQAGGEMTEIDYKAWYSQDDDVMKVSSRFSLGVTPVFVNRIGYAKI